MRYEIYIFANWGMSKPDIVLCDSKEEMLKKFNDIPLGGVGCVYGVKALVDGKTYAIKRLEDIE